MRDLQGQSEAMISQDFAVADGLPGESAIEQPDIEILPFHVVYGHSGAVWIANFRDTLDSLKPNPSFAARFERAEIRRRRVNLHFDTVVDFVVKNNCNPVFMAGAVRFERITGELETPRDAAFQASQERLRGVAIALSASNAWTASN